MREGIQPTDGKRNMKLTRRAALAEFETGNPSTKAFEAFGLGFEAFLRWSSAPEKNRADAINALRAVADVADLVSGRQAK